MAFNPRGRLGSVSFYSPSFKTQFRIAARLVCSFCEAMVVSLSVASTAGSSAKVAMVDSGVVDNPETGDTFLRNVG
jgi:hypothetical protein